MANRKERILRLNDIADRAHAEWMRNGSATAALLEEIALTLIDELRAADRATVAPSAPTSSPRTARS